jgi:hypothetical protein
VHRATIEGRRCERVSRQRSRTEGVRHRQSAFCRRRPGRARKESASAGRASVRELKECLLVSRPQRHRQSAFVEGAWRGGEAPSAGAAPLEASVALSGARGAQTNENTAPGFGAVVKKWKVGATIEEAGEGVSCSSCRKPVRVGQRSASRSLGTPAGDRRIARRRTRRRRSPGHRQRLLIHRRYEARDPGSVVRLEPNRLKAHRCPLRWCSRRRVSVEGGHQAPRHGCSHPRGRRTGMVNVDTSRRKGRRHRRLLRWQGQHRVMRGLWRRRQPRRPGVERVCRAVLLQTQILRLAKGITARSGSPLPSPAFADRGSWNRIGVGINGKCNCQRIGFVKLRRRERVEITVRHADPPLCKAIRWDRGGPSFSLRRGRVRRRVSAL